MSMDNLSDYHREGRLDQYAESCKAGVWLDEFGRPCWDVKLRKVELRKVELKEGEGE